MSERVVVTGAGVISSIGAGVDEFERNLYAGMFRRWPQPAAGRDGRAAEVRNFNPQPWLGNKGIRVLDRSARLLSVAAHMALTATGLQQQEGGEGDPEPGTGLRHHVRQRPQHHVVRLERPNLGLIAAVLVGGALAAGGANTINCWIERDRDQLMRRTHAPAAATGDDRPGAGARVRARARGARVRAAVVDREPARRPRSRSARRCSTSSCTRSGSSPAARRTS